MLNCFKTIETDASSEYIEKKSKFIAYMFYVENVDDAEKAIQAIKKKHYDAKHNCYAYRILKDDGVVEKSSDDGEPSGTAGAPILNILSKNQLVNVLVIVTRYFGGILLGTGGLTRAYSEATTNSLKNTNIIEKVLGFELKIIICYSDLEIFKYWCRQKNILIKNENFSDNVELIIEVSKELKDIILNKSDQLNIKILKSDILKEKYIKKHTEK